MKRQNAKTRKRQDESRIAKTTVLAFWLFGILAFSGCIGGQPDPHIKQIQELEDKVAAQGRLLAQKEEQIKSQAETIRQLRTGVKDGSEQLVRVGKIELERLSGGYDDNSDGVPDGIVLYLRTLDTEGETMKAAGSARVRLYDLSLPEGQQLLLNVSYTPQQLKELWFGRFMTAHYTFKCPFDEKFKRPTSGNVTAVVNFTELLTGRGFDTQQVLSISKSPE